MRITHVFINWFGANKPGPAKHKSSEVGSAGYIIKHSRRDRGYVFFANCQQSSNKKKKNNNQNQSSWLSTTVKTGAKSFGILFIWATCNYSLMGQSTPTV